ncbi:MAG: pyridoxal-phosphate dependent enzyme [Chloroflexi bacterium]|nr:pyridoxal-phosphate dependent enzyme [Chloroflexota bacterium]
MVSQSLPHKKTASLPANSLAAVVGNTPLLELKRITAHLPSEVQIFAKAEWFNPGGSVKARPAWGIIQTALKAAALAGGKHLLDSTSGNMGIAYASLGASLGIPVSLAIPSNASPERLTILRAMGVELTLSDPLEGSDGAILVAQHMATERPEKYFYADQYNNQENWRAHYRTTGPEIWRQTAGELTHFVAGLGTTGTVTGTGRYLLEQNPDIEIIAFEPDSPFHGLEGLKHISSSIQPGIFDPTLADRTLGISTETAHHLTRRLAREEGLFVGVSSGAALEAAMQVAGQLTAGVVVTVFPDAGYKYLSEKFWELES